MICRARLITALAALLIGTLFAPTGAQAHFVHGHTTAVAKQHTTAVVKQKAPSLGLKSASADQRGRAAFAKMPLKSVPAAPVSCDGLCCLGFGLSCCSAAIAPHLGSFILPVWHRVGFYRPPASPHASINPSGPAKPPRSFI